MKTAIIAAIASLLIACGGQEPAAHSINGTSQAETISVQDPFYGLNYKAPADADNPITSAGQIAISDGIIQDIQTTYSLVPSDMNACLSRLTVEQVPQDGLNWNLTGAWESDTGPVVVQTSTAANGCFFSYEFATALANWTYCCAKFYSHGVYQCDFDLSAALVRYHTNTNLCSRG